MTECPTDDGGGGYSGYAMWTAFGVGGFCSVVLAVVLIRFRANIRLYMLRREQSYDVFLSYRVASDALLVERLYMLLTKEKELNVWLDKKCLTWGQPWEQGFVDGLRSSLIVVPVLSRPALQAFSTLDEGSGCDNFLLEHALALELKERGVVWGITPLLVGEADEPAPPALRRRSSAVPEPAATPSRSRSSSTPSHHPVLRTRPSTFRLPQLTKRGSGPESLPGPVRGFADASAPAAVAPPSPPLRKLREETIAAGLTSRNLSWSNGPLFSFGRKHLTEVTFDQDFFECGGVPSCADVEVPSVWLKVLLPPPPRPAPPSLHPPLHIRPLPPGPHPAPAPLLPRAPPGGQAPQACRRGLHAAHDRARRQEHPRRRACAPGPQGATAPRPPRRCGAECHTSRASRPASPRLPPRQLAGTTEAALEEAAKAIAAAVALVLKVPPTLSEHGVPSAAPKLRMCRFPSRRSRRPRPRRARRVARAAAPDGASSVSRCAPPLPVHGTPPAALLRIKEAPRARRTPRGAPRSGPSRRTRDGPSRSRA